MKNQKRNLNVEEMKNVAGGNYFEVKELTNALIYQNKGHALDDIFWDSVDVVCARYPLADDNWNAYSDEVAVEMMRRMGFEGNIGNLSSNTYSLNGKTMTHQEVLDYIKSLN